RLRQIAQTGIVLGELGSNLWSHLIAALADSRTDSHKQFSGAARELHPHRFDRARGDLPCGAAPAGVNGSDGAMNRIHDQNRNTIGCLDRDERSGRIFEQRVAIAEAARTAAAFHDRVAMNLMESRQMAATAETVRLARAEAMDEPLESIEMTHAVNLLRILIKHAP